jgi:uncharacterized protein (TIGR03085 family)
VSPPNYAGTERAALCDLLLAVGPEQPTLCAGWSTADLAAHLVTRERRPDAAAGIALPPLAGHTERVRRDYARRPFAELVALLRRPPRWTFSGVAALDRALNVGEYFIHHEDVRRARPGWRPRPLEHRFAAQLWAPLKLTARLALRRFPGRVDLVAVGHGTVTAGHSGSPAGVTVAGDPGELALFVSGRQAHSQVELTGDPQLIDRIGRPDFGRH